MKKYIYLKYIMIFAVSLMLMANTSPVEAQQKLQNSPGGYHGELDFPISWKRYYSYAEWTKIMHDLQKQYSNLADIESIGKSRMGRDQFLLTISAKSTGSHTEKTAMWVDGAIHGNEVNGVMCSLYLAWYLLTRYDYDAYVHDLVNNYTFYILPGLHVDANESFVVHPNTPNNPREPYRPEDNDGDGLYDEDQTEDVDGDGELSTMYIVDPQGEFKLSYDKRRFVAVEDESEKVMRFRRIGSEGYDNDGDGRINEDDLGGPDPNRNFAYGWNLQAGWPYPMSEVECRNVYEFQRTHPNIFASFHYHNTGRLIMFQAPPADRSVNMNAEQRRQYQERLDNQLVEMRKTNQYAQLFNRIVSSDYQTDMDVQTEITTMGARILKNYRPTIGGLSGQAHAATYYMLGAYSYLIELWGSPAFDADQDGDGRVTDEEYVIWCDIELTGEGWINPYKFNHPDLGEIWMGGTRKKHTVRTPPARHIEMETFKNAQFVMYCASQFPKVEIDEVKVTPATDDLYWIDVAVKNDRIYPTSSDRAVQLEIAVNDKMTFSSSSNVSQIEITEGSSQIDPGNFHSNAKSATGEETEFRLKSKDKQWIRYLVKMSGASGWVEFNVESKYGGKTSRRINLRVSN
ncbi:M14 family metallopeptidase [candidate division KSB1 bacterium]